MAPGEELEAEIAADPDQREKLAIIARHYGARELSRTRQPSGRWVVRLAKADPEDLARDEPASPGPARLSRSRREG